MYCSKCGNQLSDDAVFCSKCGNKVEKETKDNNQEDTTYQTSQKTQDRQYSYQQDPTRDDVINKMQTDDYYTPQREAVNYEGLNTGEKAGICLGNICLSPLLGIILYFVWKSDKPQKSEDVCMVTVASVIISIVLAVLFAIMGG